MPSFGLGLTKKHVSTIPHLRKQSQTNPCQQLASATMCQPAFFCKTTKLLGYSYVIVGKLMLKTSPLSPTAFLNLSSSKIKVYKIWTPFRSMQIKTSWPNGHHGTKDLVTNSKLACACWWSLGIELRVFLSLSGASNQHTFTPHADRAAEISNQRFFYLHLPFKSTFHGSKIFINSLLLWGIFYYSRGGVWFWISDGGGDFF